MMKFKELARVVSQERLAEDIFSLWIETKIAQEAEPGQFISVYPKDTSRLLPRPISICETDGGRLRIVYRVVGEGTKEFSGYVAGDSIDILGPLGNGFPKKNETAILIGGGIGIPPMVALAKSRPKEKNIIVVGYRNTDLFLIEELSQYGRLYIAIENIDADNGGDGIIQIEHLIKSRVIEACTEGNVLDAIRENAIQAEVLYACGPTPMLKAVKAYASEHAIRAWLSLEQRMACGIGACLACVCDSTEIDAHSKVKNKRVCKEGPVFSAADIVL